nr:hypothetical protein HmN_000802300 [Hymenolepis microstoma]
MTSETEAAFSVVKLQLSKSHGLGEEEPLAGVHSGVSNRQLYSQQKSIITHHHIISVSIAASTVLKVAMNSSAISRICSNLGSSQKFRTIDSVNLQVAASWMKRPGMAYYNKAWLQKFCEGLKFEQICEMTDEFIATFNTVDAAIEDEVM